MDDKNGYTVSTEDFPSHKQVVTIGGGVIG